MKRELDELPDNTQVTQEFCSRFDGILVVDGKYIKVRGYAQKIPFIYGIDYATHDIPVGLLAPAESEEVFHHFFKRLHACNYPLKVVVCDDVVSALKPALLQYYPDAKIQLCQNHYIEHIRQQLNVRTRAVHQRFFAMLYHGVFRRKGLHPAATRAIFEALKKRAARDADRRMILAHVELREQELFAHELIKNCPRDTNLIELYNSHLNARLRGIKGFKSFRAAEQWLNGYLLRRRTKPFTDCDTKFRHLNGSCSLQLTLTDPERQPRILGLSPSKKNPK